MSSDCIFLTTQKSPLNINRNVTLKNHEICQKFDKKMKIIILKDETLKRTGLFWCFFLRKCLVDDDVFK